MDNYAQIMICHTFHATSPKWIRLWKASTSRAWARPGEHPIWQKDAWDRQLRDGEHYGERWEYVRNNPRRQHLVNSADDWKWQGEVNLLPW